LTVWSLIFKPWRKGMKTIKALFWGLFVVVLIIFIVQNLQALSHTESLRLNLFFTSFQSPELQVSFLFILCFVLGFLLAYGLGLIQRRRLKKIIKELERCQARSENELKSLRTLPVKEEPALNSGRKTRGGAAG